MATVQTSTAHVTAPKSEKGYYLLGEDFNSTDHIYRHHHHDILLVKPNGIQNRITLGFLGKTIDEYVNWWSKRCGWRVRHTSIRGKYNYVGETVGPDGRTRSHYYRYRDAKIIIIADDTATIDELDSVSPGETIHDYVKFVTEKTSHDWQDRTVAAHNEPLLPNQKQVSEARNRRTS
jgi:hypothetical protein